MKHLITAIALLFIGQTSFAQNEYDDLKILFADGNYEKLVAVADKYTQKDDSKYHIPPYYWLSRGLYEISESGTTDEKFKNAYKDAIKYLGKAIKYDVKKNDGSTISDPDYSEYIEMLQMTCVERIINELEADAYKKAYSWSIKYQKITLNLVGVKYLQGACKYKSSDKSSARLLWKDAGVMMDEISSIEDWSDADKLILKTGLLESAKIMKESQQADKAKNLLNKAAPWFEGDEDWKIGYDEIMY